ncbi:MAG: hypothetical protein ACM3U1_08870 [Chloroflexota bacterium]
MYYRRKVILAVLEQFGGEMPEADLQSALFLLCDRQEEPSFEFLPLRQVRIPSRRSRTF